MHENKDGMYCRSVHFETLLRGIIFKIYSAAELKNVIRWGQGVGHGCLMVVEESYLINSMASKEEKPHSITLKIFEIED